MWLALSCRAWQASPTSLALSCMQEHHMSPGPEKHSERVAHTIAVCHRWDTFGKLVPEEQLPESEAKFRGRYTKAPSFLTFHLGVKADVLPEGCACHHIIVEDWDKMEEPRGTLFVSIPTLLDPSLSPPGDCCSHADFQSSWPFALTGAEQHQQKQGK